MDIVDQVKKIEAFHVSVSIFGFVGVVSPGLLTLFLFKRDLFISLDLMKLLLLSVSLSLPIIVFNYFLWGKLTKFDSKIERYVLLALLMALIISSIIFYGALAVAFFAGLSLHTYLWTLVASEIVLVLIVALISIADGFKKKTWPRRMW